MSLNNTVWNVAVTQYKIGAGSMQTIGAVSNSSINSNIEVNREITAGRIRPTTAVVQQVQPMASIAFLQVAQAFNMFGTTGQCIDPAADLLAMYAQKRICKGPDDPNNAVHLKYDFQGGIIAPNRLTCEHRQNAEYAVDIYAITDDSNNAPVIMSTSQQLPTPIADTDRWTIGPNSQVAGVPFEGKTGFDIDFGITVTQQSSDSEIYDSFVGISSEISKITIRGLDLLWFNSLGDMLNGEAAAHLDTILYLQKRGVATNVAEHIKITAAGLAYTPTIIDGTATEPATVTLDIDPIEDATGAAPIIYDTASTIP